jgi:hypothetical protein
VPAWGLARVGASTTEAPIMESSGLVKSIVTAAALVAISASCAGSGTDPVARQEKPASAVTAVPAPSVQPEPSRGDEHALVNGEPLEPASNHRAGPGELAEEKGVLT